MATATTTKTKTKTTKKTTAKKTTKKRATPKKNLVIVESPAKAKTIEKYLGRNYKVVASVGHIRDLKKSSMSIDFENNYEPQYINIRGKGPLINELKKEAKKAKQVFLASDPDREGEAISWHLSHILGLDDHDKNRVVFNEITKDAVKNAFVEPRAIDMDLVDAQQARRVLDRIVGYSISPLLWKKVKKGLSAGRVQSVALKLIIDRENEIKAFKPEEYWTIDGAFKKGAKKFQASFYGLDGKKLKLNNNDDVQAVLSRITSDDFNVDKVEKKERRRNAPLPYTTSSLQQDAANKINFRTRKTMMVAQQLYEGINLGSGAQGLITYMRTDSTRISPVAQNQAAEFITERFGSKYSKHGSKVKNSSAAQDAHEAIRPSNVFQTPESIAKYLDKDQLKLYTLIWNRFVASQMTAAVFDTMKVTLSQNGVIFTANGSQIKFDGYMAVYNDSDKNKMLPDMAEGDTVKKVVTTPEQHFTQPPARYSEATLIKTLEENGVGRPSTYAPTLDVIQRRYYVKLVAKRFEPTELGEIVNSLIVESSQTSWMLNSPPRWKGNSIKSKSVRNNGRRSLMNSSNLSKKNWKKLKKVLKKSKLRMSLLVLIVTSVVTQWLSNLVATVSSTHVVISQTVITPRPLLKKLALLVQPVVKVRSSNVRQNVIVSSMVVIAILTVNLRRGIFLLDVTVLNQAITSSRRKYVVVANKSSVVTKSVTTKNLLLNKDIAISS